MTRVPTLPIEAVRQAVAGGEWELAAQLLAQHEHAVRAALGDRTAPLAGDREPWLALLSSQRAMLEELRGARDETARALQQLTRDRRGVKAYLGEG